MFLHQPSGRCRASVGPGRARVQQPTRTPRRPVSCTAGVGSPLSAAVRRAHASVSGRHYVAAYLLLQAFLGALDPIAAPDDSDLIEAALLMHQLGHKDSPERLGWDRYAYEASTRLHGAGDARTLQAAGALATTLTLAGDRDAIALHQQVVNARTRQGNTDGAITARLALAGALHRFGSCDDAAAEARTAWSDWRDRHGLRDPGGILVAVPLTAILIACNRSIEAKIVLGQLWPVLPPAASQARADLIALISGTVERHDGICARSPGNGVPPEPPDARPRPDRRADWRDVLR